MKLFRISLLSLLASVAITSCGGGNGPTTVDSITIARDDGNGGTGETVESLKPTDQHFHATIKLNKGKDATVKADLIAVDTPEGKNITVLTKDYPVGGIENTVNLDYSLPNPWPAGSYKIDAYVDGKLSKSKEFMIQ